MENEQHLEQSREVDHTSEERSMVIPVVQERMTVDKEVVETGKVIVHTTVTEQEATVNVPVVSENYEVQRIPINKIFSTAPQVRYEGDVLIVPVIEEVVVVEKRYKVIEEVHLVKRTTETPFMQQVTLLKENVQVERTSSNGDKTNL